MDAWSLGCVLGELLLHRPLMPGATEIKQFSAMCELLGSPNEKIWPGFRALPLAKTIQLPLQPYNELPSRLARVPPTPETLDLLNGLLAYDPRKRLTTRDAAAHPYFTSWPLPQPPGEMPSFAAHSFSRHTGADHAAAAERYAGRAKRAASASADKAHAKRQQQLQQSTANGGAGGAGAARRKSCPGPAVCAQLLLDEDSASTAPSAGADGGAGALGADVGADGGGGGGAAGPAQGPREAFGPAPLPRPRPPSVTVARLRSPSSVFVSGVTQL